jgi:uncharacterized protein
VKSNNFNKLKIFNDPVYGFVHIPFELIYDLIEHPYFQRLRRIKQLGMTHLVYPGALHTRFHHAMGAMHLMGEAIEIIRAKGQEITEEEAQAVTIAVLLHDIGHGPFSHALEHSIVHNITHEDISALFMDRLNIIFEGKLTLALRIFRNDYHKKFLHQLVSSQLDVDRLDYLKRDSFFTGVSEGVISSDRIIKMFNVADDQLVVEAKGIYSIEKFIIARRLMYWQVYLHKTVISAEYLLVKILQRAKELAEKGIELFSTEPFKEFLYNKHDKNSFLENPEVLDIFASLDDLDIFTSIKVWAGHQDAVLSTLCNNIVNRQLFKIELQKEPFDQKYLEDKKQNFINDTGFTAEEASYFIFSDSISNNAYDPKSDRINLLYKNGLIVDIAEAADQLNISALSTPVKKYFACYPKNC